MASITDAIPVGVSSLLDTDLYKLTMQCAVLKYFPQIEVTYGFTNRTPHMNLNREGFHWLQDQINKLENITITTAELEFLRKTCPYLTPAYLTFLESFRPKPKQDIEISFTPESDTNSDADIGEVKVSVSGKWVDTILYEIPLLALTSEAYFRFVERDWNYDGQEEKAYQKGRQLLENGCIFSEFGTRRRRNFHTQDIVMMGLSRAVKEANTTTTTAGWTGKFSGTSNVYLAMKYGVAPVGTVAHEWYMGIAAITDDYEHANEQALNYWLGCFGEGVLGIALTDTFGTPAFLRAFKEKVPSITTDAADGSSTGTGAPADTTTTSEVQPDGRTYANVFTGVRQDSGDPANFVKMVRDFYDGQGIKDKKTIVFSDSLNVQRCIEYKDITEKAGLQPTFGVGTFFTNDFTQLSTGQGSTPLNIVIKLSSVNGRPAIKLSDNIGKNTGDAQTVLDVKRRLGYTEKDWGVDERTRWGGKV